MRRGLKAVRHRRDDALSRIGWDRLETLLAEHYRREGYAVEHVGTGGSGQRFDGGIDLKLRKDDAYILVQSKHWNAYQVTHNAVHELLGVMVNQGATGAILVTSGEFTRAAIVAATKQGRVQLIDGDALRAMLGPLPEPAPSVQPAHAAPSRMPRAGVGVRDAMASGLWLIVLKLGFALLLFWFLMHSFNRALKPLTSPRVPAAQESTRLPEPAGRPPNLMAQPASSPPVTDAMQPAYQPPTPEDIRESRRKADEAMKVIEANTPEM